MTWADFLNVDKLFAGFWFAMGSLAVLIAASFMRSVAVAGGSAMLYLTRLAHSWFNYRLGNDETINVTLNTTRDGVLTIDTWIDEHKLSDIWHNHWHVVRLKGMAKLCTEDDPVIKFRRKVRGKWVPVKPTGIPKHSEYRRTYDRLINKIAACLANQNSLDYSLGKPMVAHRYVVALTYEKLCDLRSQHFRVMVVREAELLDFPEKVRVTRPELTTRFETLKAIARQYREDYAVNPEQPERFGILLVWRPPAPIH
jgi:hypothetical protein